MNVRSRIAACTALIAAIITAAPASPALAAHTNHTPVAAAGGARLWLARYHGPPANPGSPGAVVVSPGGSAAFVVGTAAVGYNTGTGAQLWATPTGLLRSVHAAVSPDGGRLLVTGQGASASGLSQYRTESFSTVTGALEWTATYRGPGGANASPQSIAVSPDGSRVFVTGSGSNITAPGVSGDDIATVAYDTATGARLWLARYVNGSVDAEGSAVAVSPGGATVFVSGTTFPSNRLTRVTVAYDAGTGARRWLTTFRPAAPERGASGGALEVSPDGATVYVMGLTYIPGNHVPLFQQQYQVQAYAAATGAIRWTSAPPAPGGPRVYGGAPVAMALSPDGATVFVTGQDYLRGSPAYGTVAFSAATGAKLWSSQAALNDFGLPADIAVNPAGSRVFVTGYTQNPEGGSSATEYATVAYAAGSGATLWTRFYPGPVSGFSQATSVAVTPDGARVLVTGFSQGDFATIAYRS